jgi:cell wall-associated NlpC family hydrolase
MRRAAGLPACAVVSLPAIDLRRRPGHAFELRSQLLLGEVVGVLAASRDDQWWQVENRTDRYRGWIRRWGLIGVTASRARAWTRIARARVVVPHAQVRSRPGAGVAVSPVFWNDRLIAGRRRGRHRPVELPDGRRGWIEDAALETRPGSRIPVMIERVKGLLGVPYLWGGRTPLGFDCSGFTQQVLAEQGFAIPRDARDQHAAARPLASGESDREGDLVFFGSLRGPAAHVGLGLGGGYFAHSRGHVRISSLDPDNPLCDKEIVGLFRGWRRPVRQLP